MLSVGSVRNWAEQGEEGDEEESERVRRLNLCQG